MAALFRLALAFDVETEYLDDHGERRVADPEVLMAVVRSLGALVDGVGDCDEALRAERLRQHRQVLEPVAAGPAGGPIGMRVRLAESVDPERVGLRLVAEDGSVAPLGADRLIEVGRPTVDGETRVEYDLLVSGAGPRRLDPGYYDLRVDALDGEHSSLIVVAPTCPLPARGWGAFVSLPAVRTATNWGVGSYSELTELTRWIGDAGGAFVGTLPLYPTFVDPPDKYSPYLPVTRLGWSELFIDPHSVPERDGCPEAGVAESIDLSARLIELRAANTIDFAAVAAVLRPVMESMARTLFATPSSRRQELEAFAASRPELVAYARFRSALEQGHRPADHQRDHIPADVGVLDEGGRYHLYCQWVASTQLDAIGDHLYLDLPVGVHPEGFDGWWERDSFVAGIEGGAPPDAFFSSGQTWGFRPLHPWRIRQDRYRYPLACLRQIMGCASVVRIDHVPSLRRLYWVPAGAPADQGAYVRYRLHEMQGIVALEAHRSGTAVVGEDLGTVPDQVREAMAASHMLRSWVLQFEVSPEDPLPDPPDEAMATIGTHDLPRFAPFWEGDDIDDMVARHAQSAVWAGRERERRRSWREAVEPDASTMSGLLACLDHLAGSPARLSMVDLEDLWLERRQINRPGSGPEVPNWSDRMPRPLDELRSDPAVAALLAEFSRRRHRMPVAR
jgi:4-alpha-glucanotransferase